MKVYLIKKNGLSVLLLNLLKPCAESALQTNKFLLFTVSFKTCHLSITDAASDIYIPRLNSNKSSQSGKHLERANQL